MKHNKHITAAMLVAPILAVLAYFGAGHLFGEKPQPAVEGQTYRLAEKPNCRWDSGRCGLRNADFELEFSITGREPGRLALQLQSVFPLDGALLAVIAGDGSEEGPQPMRAEGTDGLIWSTEIRMPQPDQDRLRLAASVAGVSYYGEVSTEFTGIQPEAD